MPKKIFISYRRETDQGSAGRLFDQLENVFDRNQIFFDVDRIALGDDFVETIKARVDECSILLAMVGKRWVEIKDINGLQRLSNPEDWVRVEIESALNNNKRVIPILVDGADMPHRDQIPDSLAPFTRRQAHRLWHDSFKFDVQRLSHKISQIFIEEESEAEKSRNVQRSEEKHGQEEFYESAKAKKQHQSQEASKITEIAGEKPSHTATAYFIDPLQATLHSPSKLSVEQAKSIIVQENIPIDQYTSEFAPSLWRPNIVEETELLDRLNKFKILISPADYDDIHDLIYSERDEAFAHIDRIEMEIESMKKNGLPTTEWIAKNILVNKLVIVFGVFGSVLLIAGFCLTFI